MYTSEIPWRANQLRGGKSLCSLPSRNISDYCLSNKLNVQIIRVVAMTGHEHVMVDLMQASTLLLLSAVEACNHCSW